MKISENVLLARNLLKQEDFNIQEAQQTVEKLKGQSKFGYAAMLLERIHKVQPKDNDTLLNLALCIYKDVDLPATIKYDAALRYTSLVVPNDDDKIKCRQFAQYGAIFKRKWQSEGNLTFLENALANYKSGYLIWAEKIKETQFAGEQIENLKHGANDNGYNAVNYAFCLDLYAMVKGNSEIEKDDVKKIEADANTVREKIVKYYLGFSNHDFSDEKAKDAIEKWHPKLKANQWIYGTLGETFFGLKNYDAAQYFYLLFKDRMLRNNILTNEDGESWMTQITAQQLYNLSFIQIEKQINAKQNQNTLTHNTHLDRQIRESLTEKHKEVLKVLIPNPSNIGDLKYSEKIGIGLSGGGFRAALYHIGVLARLAELDILRHVEVISCVSGGSIIGAYYYLKVKNLLEEKPDGEIEQVDYIRIVQEIEVDFLAAVQKNLREQVLTKFSAIIRMSLEKDYSRTHRLGELYEEHIYSKLMKDKNAPIHMNELKIYPAERNTEGNVVNANTFSLKQDNWYRRNKVPNLVLNATSLNTGHIWQFTASWMGEPPANLQTEVDMKSRLRRVYYGDAPDKYKNFRLGYAVASSSCVPGLFAPFAMSGLYPGVDLKLVDGGVHDNQGITSLIEQECRYVIVSDASGQLTEENEILSSGFLSVMNRTNGILQERIRENGFMELATRERSSQITTFKFMHLKKQLYPKPIAWEGCDEDLHFLVKEKMIDLESDTTITEYQINAKVQDLISKLRTDLDAFSDQEAYALMYSGYQMTRYEFRQGKEFMEASSSDWKFFAIQDVAAKPAKEGRFKDVLKTGAAVFNKVLEISNLVLVSSYIFAGLFIFGLVYYIIERKNFTFDDITWMGFVLPFFAIIFVLFLCFNKKIKKYFNLPSILSRLILLLLGIVVVYPLVNFYMFVFNNMYLAFGSILKKKEME